MLLLSPLKHAISVALISTTTQRAGQGLTASFTHLLNGIRELFQQLADQRLNEVAMPILGAGHGGIDPPRALTGLLLALAEASQYQRGKQRRKVKIVIYKKSINDPSEVSTALARQILQLMANDD